MIILKSGIYLITNICNGKKYVGQSLNVKRRIGRHKSELRYNKHHNIYLQREFNKYGESCFEFSILEYCSPSELDTKEIKLISRLQTIDCANGYNLEGGGNINKFISEGTRLKKVGKNNPMYGKHISEKHKSVLRMANLGTSDKLTTDDVEAIKISLVGNTQAARLAEKYNVCVSTIDKIAKVKNWDWVRNDLNEQLLNKFLNKKENIRQRNNKIKDMFNAGICLNQIRKELKVDGRVVSNVLGENQHTVLLKRNNEIVDDFKKGMSKENIMKKYNISSSVYVSVTKNAYKLKVESEKEKAIAMRLKGVSVTNIAEQMNKHRTTITEWTKHIISSS